MGIVTTGAAGGLAADAVQLERLRGQARNDPQAALKSTAQQFEALLLGMLLKSMRETTSQNTPFDSEQTRLLQSMLDQQFAQVLSARGIGLAEVMTRQLSNPGTQPGTQTPRGAGALPSPSAPVEAPVAPSSAVPRAAPSVSEFVNDMWPHALEAGRQTGIAPHFILAQAALESGWGRSEIRGSDGTPSRNLFGIKAGGGWTGPVAEAATTEYVNGAPQRGVARFRAYGSYAEAFSDYARLLQSQPRYAQVLERGGDAVGFARGLQQAGYATDPMYADKLVRIINGGALRAGLAG